MAAPEGEPIIGIIMGSDSDLPTMEQVAIALGKVGVTPDMYEERVLSAHRTAPEMFAYAQEAEERGLEVIIAGAGGSAHLPGMVASETLVPVLGVACTSKLDVMNRALGSMIGMPKGKPLATFQGESGAFNAGLFTARLVMRGRPVIRAAYLAYEQGLRDESMSKDVRLRAMGSRDYSPVKVER
jgi:5-(carboxyamino)imidazole ribonucleotide mutase